jgi:hypothetical protein
MVKKVPEEAEDPRLSDAIISQHTPDFPFHILPRPHASIQNCSTKEFVWLDIS